MPPPTSMIRHDERTQTTERRQYIANAAQPGVKGETLGGEMSLSLKGPRGATNDQSYWGAGKAAGRNETYIWQHTLVPWQTGRHIP